MKKFLSIAVAFVVLCTSFVTTSFAVTAGTLTIENKTVKTTDSEFTVNFNLSGSDPLGTIGIMNIEFDTTRFELISANWAFTATTQLKFNYSESTPNIASAMFQGSVDVNGTVLVAKFKVLENAKTGASEISCRYSDDVGQERMDPIKGTITLNCGAHKYGDWSQKTAATCTDAQVLKRTCKNCGFEDTKNGEAAKGHQPLNDRTWTQKSPASCSAAEVLESTCATCGKDHQEKAGAAKLQHSFTNYVSDNNATCKADGTKTATCDHGCGTTKTVTDEGTKTNDHDYGSYTYNNDATCKADGTKTRTCKVCQKPETVTAENTKLDHHVFENYKSNNNATCQKNATETGKCKWCDETDTRDIENSKVSHKFTKYTSNNDATCEKDGTKTASCDYNCGTKDTVADKGTALGHKMVEDKENSKAATCEEDGYTKYKCENTGCKHTETKTIAKLGHDMLWTVTKEPTLEAEGLRDGACQREDCNHTVTDSVIPKLVKELETAEDAKLNVSIDSEEALSGFTKVEVADVEVSDKKVAGKDVVGGYALKLYNTDTKQYLSGNGKMTAKIKLTDNMLAAYKNLGIAINGTLVEATVADGYITFTASASDLANVVVVGEKIQTEAPGTTPDVNGNNGAANGTASGTNGSATSPATGEATGAALAVALFAAAAAGVVLTKKKRA